jgi:hypothetical protein
VTNTVRRAVVVFAAIALTLTLIAVPARSARAATIDCGTDTTLEILVVCIRSHMPLSGSNGFAVPGAAEQADFRAVVRQMLNGACDTIALPAALAGAYVVRTFTDVDTAKSYCLLIEVGAVDPTAKVDRGWGTFIVDGAPLREIDIAIAHPIADLTTEDQGIAVFKGTESRTFLLAGTHRRANDAASACQPALSESDAAHNVETMFFAATEEIAAWYGATSFVQLQFHGFAASTCPDVDVHLSYGLSSPPPPGSLLVRLQANIQAEHLTWSVTVPGDPISCDLNATTNVEGRLLNGVPRTACCSTPATDFTERFIHVEQAPGFRDPIDWIPVVVATWPPAARVGANFGLPHRSSFSVGIGRR